MGQELEVGHLLDNRFQITVVIARSGMASIFKAADTLSGDTVAIKVPFMQYESDPAFFSRFQREEEIGIKLRDTSNVRIYAKVAGVLERSNALFPGTRVSSG